MIFLQDFMKHYTGNEVVILDDDGVEFTPNSPHVLHLQQYLTGILGKNIVVEVATTPMQWMHVHEAKGSPLLILHDWDIGELYTFQQYFPYTVSSSIKALLDKGIPVTLYTAGTLDYARRKFFSLQGLHYVQKGDIEGVASIIKFRV